MSKNKYDELEKQRKDQLTQALVESGSEPKTTGPIKYHQALLAHINKMGHEKRNVLVPDGTSMGLNN